ncbi:hypothetical protein R1sor_008209 [Riccia sorocarpa]|uniref:Uncharacterized protein n=1 Tax=Riccia sorocarpa TaxID=122646 RepID=A0ABD3HSY2_9MARC
MRYRREVTGFEINFALEYDETRLYEFLDGGGTFDMPEVFEEEDEEDEEDDDGHGPPSRAGPVPFVGHDGAGPSTAPARHTDEGEPIVDSDPRRYVSAILSRVQSSQTDSSIGRGSAGAVRATFVAPISILLREGVYFGSCLILSYFSGACSGTRKGSLQLIVLCYTIPLRREVVSREEALRRIKAAVDARDETNSDIVIFARSDARQAKSLEEALWHMQKFSPSRFGSLTLMDDTPVTVDAAASNFLIYVDEIQNEGKSVAQVCADAVGDYNCIVRVQVQQGNILEKPVEFLDVYDVVILGRYSLSLKKKVNALCSSLSSLYIGRIIIWLIFSGHSRNKDDDKELEYSKKSCSLEDSLSVRWDSLPKRASKLFFATRIVEEFEQKVDGQPGQLTPRDVPALIAFGTELLQEQMYTPGKDMCEMVPAIESLLKKIAEAGSFELSPVCAILGGVLGQEVLKLLSFKGEPIQNFFFFDASDGNGMLEVICWLKPWGLNLILKTLQPFAPGIRMCLGNHAVRCMANFQLGPFREHRSIADDPGLFREQ